MASVELEMAALLITILVHFLGAGVLVWALLDGERVDWRRALRPDDDGGGGGRRRRGPRPPLPPTPLPDADQSAERFREAGRLADRKPRPPRRSPAEPARAPAREREPA